MKIQFNNMLNVQSFVNNLSFPRSVGEIDRKTGLIALAIVSALTALFIAGYSLYRRYQLHKIPVPTKPEDTKAFHVALNHISTNFYQQFCNSRNDSHKNFMFFTPNLIASLSMLYAGAPKELKQVLEKELCMGELTDKKWHDLCQKWSKDLQTRGQALSQTNSATSTKDQPTSFTYQQAQFLTHRSDVSLVESAKQNLLSYNPTMFEFTAPEEARQQINKKVDEVTEGKITDLVAEVDSDLVLLMASAALFKGSWQYPFEKEENSEEIFINSDGTKVVVEMMNLGSDNLKIAHDSNKDAGYRMEILELPFHGDISFLLINPNGKDKQSQLQKYVTQENIQNLLGDYEKRFKQNYGLSIGIPKVNFEDKTDFFAEFKDTPLAQAVQAANFTGSLIHTNQPSNTPALVSQVDFKLDEEGAAVAAASYSPTGNQSCDPTFRVRGPFGFAMVDRTTNTILGMGQVLKMEGEAPPEGKQW